MQTSIIVLTVLFIVGYVAYTMWRAHAEKKLPALPAWGPLPVADLTKYYSFKPGDVPIAWDAVHGWNLNERPGDLGAPLLITHAILTQQVLDFCHARNGVLALEFSFLVGAIEGVSFDAAALPAGLAPAPSGLLTIQTPSGTTLMVCSAHFAEALRQANARARGAQP